MFLNPLYQHCPTRKEVTLEKQQEKTRTQKKRYSAPRLDTFGTVIELTQTGLTHPGSDAKAGSSLSQGA